MTHQCGCGRAIGNYVYHGERVCGRCYDLKFPKDIAEACRVVEYDMFHRRVGQDAFTGERSEVAMIINFVRGVQAIPAQGIVTEGGDANAAPVPKGLEPGPQDAP